jgi:G-protein alpha subunit
MRKKALITALHFFCIVPPSYSDVSPTSSHPFSSSANRNPRFTATWIPFFDDVDAIIFLAPISAFDQVLTEDKTVNRLVRSSALYWRF